MSSDEELETDSAAASDKGEDGDEKEFRICDEEITEGTEIRSLFDDTVYSNAADLWEDMEQKYGFSLIKIKETIDDFDDMSRICLINYLRNKHAEILNLPEDLRLEANIQLVHNLVPGQADWRKIDFLTPFNANDPLLWLVPPEFLADDEE